jgi:hypothetical protein
MSPKVGEKDERRKADLAQDYRSSPTRSQGEVPVLTLHGHLKLKNDHAHEVDKDEPTEYSNDDYNDE